MVVGTKAASFNAKIQNLLDYYLRLLHGAIPVPTGNDIASTLVNFSQTLLGILREIQGAPFVMLKNRQQDKKRLSTLPSLNYHELLDTISQLADVILLVQTGITELIQALLQCICSLVVFLGREDIDTIPYLVVSIMISAPNSLHQSIVDILCYKILPFTVGAPTLESKEEENYAAASLPAILMIVFQYSECSCHHSQLLECLMSLKSDVIMDLFSVLAHGPPAARPPAANLLFHYWPNLNPTLNDRRGFPIRFQDISSVLKAMFNRSAMGAKSDSVNQAAEFGETKSPKDWKRSKCQIDDCDGEGENEAVRVCLDNIVALAVCPEMPPPLYVCKNCASSRLAKAVESEVLHVLMPMTSVSQLCQSKNCRSTDKVAISTCFDMECAGLNGYKPIRYCSQCYTNKHGNHSNHVCHTNVTNIWSLDAQPLNDVLEAIISLLNEAPPSGDKNKTKDQERLNRAYLLEEEPSDEISIEDRRVLSRYAVWLIVGVCVPTEDTPVHLLGRLIAALCHWFTATQYLPDDQQGAPIERLKTDYVQNWLQDITKTHMEVFVSCLLPHPIDYAKVGGHWDSLASKSEHIKEGFRRLFCLVPYELITLSIWERVMPHWMEAIHNEVCEKDLLEMKITLSKLLDPEMSPLGFDSTQMYTFISRRFNKSNEDLQEQTLSWLQLLSSLGIVIPIYQLLEMFQEGSKGLVKRQLVLIDKISEKTEDPTLELVIEDSSEIDLGEWPERGSSWGYTGEHQTANEKTLSCFILMFDVFYKQLEVQEIEKHKGVIGPVSIPFLTLMKDMLRSPCLSTHKCINDLYCSMCDLTISFFQLTMDILAYLLPLLAIQNNRVADMVAPTSSSKPEAKSSEVAEGSTSATNISLKTAVSNENSKVKKDSNIGTVVTATMETVGCMEMTTNTCQEEVMSVIATAATHLEAETAAAKANVDLHSVVNEKDEPIDLTKSIDAEDNEAFWNTSQGKFKFRMEELPAHLQVIFVLLQLVESAEDCDIVYHLCECLRYLILHGESLAQAATDHRGFLIWCQEKKNIHLMWNLIEAEWSHVSEVCVALLLHFLQLPSGSDIFWKLCENNFHSGSWKVRYQAVEKVVVIGRFLTVSSVKQCPGLQAAIAHAFSFLIASLDDIHVAIAQRAHLHLGSIPDTGLKALSWCLEQQFDSIILDRPMIIQALHQLSCLLPERRILTWEFFYNRFDTLYLEAQVALEKHGEIAFPRDLRNSDMTSEIFARKLSRAHDALSQVQNGSAKTLSSSLGPKWPYKRTMSAPANMFNRMEKQDRANYRVEDYTLKGLCTIPCKLFEAYFMDVVQADSGMKVFDDGTMVHQLQRAMDLEETDLDTLHLLVFLLMEFLSQPQHATVNEDKTSTKVMTFVLRHISVLMGYSPQERSFAISPQRLRASPVFNAFLSCLPQVLDHNFSMGSKLLPTCLPILHFCAAPHRMVDLRHPSFSLWCLQSHPRRWWLTSVLTIMYKFDYSQPVFSWQIISLIRIVLNCIENHFHRCRKAPVSSLCTMDHSYSRDISQLGIGEGPEGAPTPPTSPVVPTMPIIDNNELSAGIKKDKFFKDTTDKMEIEMESLYILPTSKQATVSIEKCNEHGQAIIDQPAIRNSISVGSFGKHSAVTTVMASQIQSFDDSLVKIQCLDYANEGSHLEILDNGGATSCMASYGNETSSEGSEISFPGDNLHSRSADVESSLHCSGSDHSLESDCMLSSQMYHSLTQEELKTLQNGKRRLSTSSHDDCNPHSESISYSIASNQDEERSFASSSESETVSGRAIVIMKDPMAVSYAIDTCHFTGQAQLPGMDKGLDHKRHEYSPESPHSTINLMAIDEFEELQEAVVVAKVESTSDQKVFSKKQRLVSTTEREIGPEMKGITEVLSDTSIANTVLTETSDNMSRSEVRNEPNMTRAWEEVAGGSFYSWSEPSEGSSSKDQNEPSLPPSTSIKQSSLRVGEDCMVYRCMECGELLEEFTNEDLGMCVIILATFVHRESGIAAPLLPRILRTVARVAGSEVFSWQYSTPVHLPGCARSVGRQFLRCVLHQLAPNQIFNQIFQTDIPDVHKTKLFKTLLHSLLDFSELNASAPIQLLLENLNSQKVLKHEVINHLIGNITTYIECSTHEGNVSLSSSLIPLFDTFLRKLQLYLQFVDVKYLIRTILAVMKIPGVSTHKNILDPLSKLLSFSIQNAVVKFDHLYEICYCCNRIFLRERDKQLLPRLVVFELVQAMKFKTMIPDTNLVLLVQLLLQDCGGSLEPNTALDELEEASTDNHFPHNINLSDCMRSHLHDALEFIADVHTITKVKATCKKSRVGLNEDTIGGLIKAGIAQYLALEITRGNSRDNRTTLKYLPWLNNAPTTVQQGPKEFIECVVHIRLLSWLLLGSLTHACLCGSSNMQCQPVPPEASCHIADHIQVILAGFPENSKNTVQHMSSLYQTFILAQLWTLYMEQGSGSPTSDSHTSISTILTDFWSKITPAILHLVAHSKVLGEMVALHLMSLMEALQECQSSVLTKLLPLWAPVLYTQQAKMSGHVVVRLRACQDAVPSVSNQENFLTTNLNQLSNDTSTLPTLQQWLHRLQFKMGQIEMQSSTAIQFYSV